MYTLVLIRHGQSQWNKENRFTGWTDIDLSEQGMAEANNAGKLLKENNYDFDIAYTSVLRRAIKTLWIALEEIDRMWLPIKNRWQLNERHYGALQGLNKQEMKEKHGEKQVQIWRRSFAVQPPSLTKKDHRYCGCDIKYQNLKESEIPLTESLKDTIARVMPCWQNEIVPDIQTGKKIIIAAHGNSLRALIKHLDNISDENIVNLEIPTGKPLIYHLDKNLKPIKSFYL